MTLFFDRIKQNKLVLLSALWLLHGVATLQELAALPSGDAGLTANLALVRLLTGGVVLFWIIVNLALIAAALRNPSWLTKWLAWMSQPAIKDALQVLSISTACAGISLTLLYGFMDAQYLQQYGPYLDRLLPVCGLVTNVSLELIILAVVFHLHKRPDERKPLQVFIFRWIAVLTVLGLVATVVSISGLGIAPNYKGDWSRGLPAVPLLEWQILLVFLLLPVVMYLEVRKRVAGVHRIDLWICLILWVGTVVIWLAQPVNPNASALKPHEPNFEVYPFIDAQTYDEFSQSVLVGNGFGEDKIPQRPLYIVFLMFMHVLVGQDYNDMIVLQSLFFAFFPVLLYLFGRDFAGRPVGLSIALLAILRDQLSNLVSPFTGNISYSKLYLSEIPTAIFLILFLFLGMRWIRAGFPVFWGFLLGGILGVGMLIRTQVIVALPVLLIFGYLVHPKKMGILLRNVVWMFITLLLVIGPWLWRNWQVTGEVIFDSPESQTINLALRYGRLGGNQPDVLPREGETSSAYDDRLKEMAWAAITSNPGAAIEAVMNSFLNHAVNNILVFPLRDHLHTLHELWVPADAFWERWEGTPTFTQGIVLVFYVLLFGLGIAGAWSRNGWLGFLPLALNLVYNLWTSLALLSGQRFMLTMDWSIYLYYMIGLFTLWKGFLFTLQGGRVIIEPWEQANSPTVHDIPFDRPAGTYMPAAILFFLIGLSLPLSEVIFPQRYPHRPDAEVLNSLISSSSMTNQAEPDRACLQNVLNAEPLRIVQGRVLYPRYYMAGDGEPFTDSTGYKIVDQGRLVFNMVGQMNGRIVFPMLQSPDFFPNGGDATLISGSEGEPWVVFIEQDGVERFYISASVEAAVCH